MIPRDRLSRLGIPLVGFDKKPVTALGQVDLAITFSDDLTSWTEIITFDIVNMPYQYNTILGRATLNAFSTITHHNYLCMKIPALEGVIMVHCDQDLVRQTEFKATTPSRHIHTVESNSKGLEDPSQSKWVPKAKSEGQLKKGAPRGSILQKNREARGRPCA